MKRYERFLNVAAPLATVALLVVIWAIAAKATANSLIMPTLKETFAAFFRCFSQKEFYKAYFGTIIRTLAAFLVCFGAALITSFLSYRSSLAGKAIAPVIVVVRVLPTVAVVLLLVLWTNSRVAAVIVTSLVVFPTLHENLYSSFTKVDKELLEMCDVFKVSRKDKAFKVFLPSVLPDVVAAAGAGLTLNLKLMVAAEVLAHTPASLGYMLNTAKEYFETAELTALVIVTVLTGLLLGIAFRMISAKARKVK